MAPSTPHATSHTAPGSPKIAGGTIGYFERAYPNGRRLSGVTLASEQEVVLVKGAKHPVAVTGGIVISVAFDVARHTLGDLMLRLILSAEGAKALWRAYGFEAAPEPAGGSGGSFWLGELTIPESELLKLEAKAGAKTDPLAARVHALMAACPELRQKLDTWQLRTVLPITALRRQELLAAQS